MRSLNHTQPSTPHSQADDQLIHDALEEQTAETQNSSHMSTAIPIPEARRAFYTATQRGEDVISPVEEPRPSSWPLSHVHRSLGSLGRSASDGEEYGVGPLLGRIG